MEPENLEKRRYKRVICSFPIQYRDIRKSDTHTEGSLTGNISEGGVYFTSSEFMPLAGRFALEISLPNLSRPIKAISKVAWIRKSPSSDQYELGSKFLEMRNEDKAHIVNFLAAITPQQA